MVGKLKQSVEGQILFRMAVYFGENPEENAKFVAWLTDKVDRGEIEPVVVEETFDEMLRRIRSDCGL